MLYTYIYTYVYMFHIVDKQTFCKIRFNYHTDVHFKIFVECVMLTMDKTKPVFFFC